MSLIIGAFGGVISHSLMVQRIVNFMAEARVNLGFDCCKAKTHKVVVPPWNATPFDPLCFR